MRKWIALLWDPVTVVKVYNMFCLKVHFLFLVLQVSVSVRSICMRFFNLFLANLRIEKAEEHTCIAL